MIYVIYKMIPLRTQLSKITIEAVIYSWIKIKKLNDSHVNYLMYFVYLFVNYVLVVEYEKKYTFLLAISRYHTAAYTFDYVYERKLLGIW